MSFPRIRGDEPVVTDIVYLLFMFSPHTRG